MSVCRSVGLSLCRSGAAAAPPRGSVDRTRWRAARVASAACADGCERGGPCRPSARQRRGPDAARPAAAVQGALPNLEVQAQTALRYSLKELN